MRLLIVSRTGGMWLRLRAGPRLSQVRVVRPGRGGIQRISRATTFGHAMTATNVRLTAGVGQQGALQCARAVAGAFPRLGRRLGRAVVVMMANGRTGRWVLQPLVVFRGRIITTRRAGRPRARFGRTEAKLGWGHSTRLHPSATDRRHRAVRFVLQRATLIVLGELQRVLHLHVAATLGG